MFRSCPFLVVLGLAAVGCGGVGESSEATLPPDTSPVETTPPVTEATTTTTAVLSEEEQAEADITELVRAWGLDPIDSSKGEAGYQIELTTGRLKQRSLELLEELAAENQVERSRGGERIEIKNLEIDLEDGTAQVAVCQVSDIEAVDGDTGEMISADDLLPGQATLLFARVEDDWLIEEFDFPRTYAENVPCDFTGAEL